MSAYRDSVPCGTCGESTTFTGTKRCNNCYEVELRLAAYLRRGGDNAMLFVSTAMGDENVRRRAAPSVGNTNDSQRQSKSQGGT